MKKVNTQPVEQSGQASGKYGETEFSYGFYSRVLDKPFDTLEELRKAEQEFLAVEEAKRCAAEARKNKAAVVEKAFKELNAAKLVYNEEVTALYSELAKNIEAAKVAYNEGIKKSNEKLDTAQVTYNEALNKFIEEHPEGYHLTLKDGDNVVTIRSNNAAEATIGEDFTKKFFDSFYKFFK
jgi:hypothetical protein